MPRARIEAFARRGAKSLGFSDVCDASCVVTKDVRARGGRVETQDGRIRRHICTSMPSHTILPDATHVGTSASNRPFVEYIVPFTTCKLRASYAMVAATHVDVPFRSTFVCIDLRSRTPRGRWPTTASCTAASA